jgi:hypothetical protein
MSTRRENLKYGDSTVREHVEVTIDGRTWQAEVKATGPTRSGAARRVEADVREWLGLGFGPSVTVAVLGSVWRDGSRVSSHEWVANHYAPATHVTEHSTRSSALTALGRTACRIVASHA